MLPGKRDDILLQVRLELFDLVLTERHLLIRSFKGGDALQRLFFGARIPIGGCIVVKRGNSSCFTLQPFFQHGKKIVEHDIAVIKIFHIIQEIPVIQIRGVFSHILTHRILIFCEMGIIQRPQYISDRIVGLKGCLQIIIDFLKGCSRIGKLY